MKENVTKRKKDKTKMIITIETTVTSIDKW